MATVREFVDFWIANSVHADETFGPHRGQSEVQELVDRFVSAARDQGFTEADIEHEVGDIYEHLRALINRLNDQEQRRRAGLK